MSISDVVNTLLSIIPIVKSSCGDIRLECPEMVFNNGPYFNFGTATLTIINNGDQDTTIMEINMYVGKIKKPLIEVQDCDPQPFVIPAKRIKEIPIDHNEVVRAISHIDKVESKSLTWEVVTQDGRKWRKKQCKKIGPVYDWDDKE